MDFRIAVIFISLAVSEGCHLHGICRKKRDLDMKDSGDASNASQSRKRRSIHGGCAAARMASPEYGYKKTLKSYSLRDEAINSQLVKCVRNKIGGFPIPFTYVPLRMQELIHYYFVYNWYQYNRECSSHTRECAAFKVCIIELIRMEYTAKYRRTYLRG